MSVLNGTAEQSAVMVEILNGGGISLQRVADRFPPFRGDSKVHPSTVFRWISKGVKLPGGGVVRLEAVRVGGKWLTTEGALRRFIQAQTPDLSDPKTQMPLTPRGKQLAEARAARAAARAGQQLEKLGI